VVDFAHIHHCVFVYPQRVTMTHARDKRLRAHSRVSGAIANDKNARL